MWLSHCMDVFR